MPNIEVHTKNDLHVELIRESQSDIAVLGSQSPSIEIQHEEEKPVVESQKNVHVTIEQWDGKTTSEKAYDMAEQAILLSQQAFGLSTDLIMQKYTLEEYMQLRSSGQLKHKMYCVYTKSRLDYIYIGRTLVAKRADAGEAVTITRFPMIFPIIFA